MKTRPILFSGEMVRAILDGRKTQTRRVMKPQPPDGHWWNADHGTMILASQYYPSEPGPKGCPCGIVGDRLWLRETWTLAKHVFLGDGIDGPKDPETNAAVMYRATWERSENFPDFTPKWRPSIHMPRWASRITLEVTGVRVERVQAIGETDAIAEGCLLASGYEELARTMFAEPHREVFHDLWDSIYAKRGYGWDVNPWVWVVEFVRED